MGTVRPLWLLKIQRIDIKNSFSEALDALDKITSSLAITRVLCFKRRLGPGDVRVIPLSNRMAKAHISFASVTHLEGSNAF